MPRVLPHRPPIAVTDLSAATSRWPRFAAEARRIGFASVHALPMRLRTDVIGAFNLFGTQPDALDEDTIRLGQAMADVATIGLLQARAIRHSEALAEQLQTALNSRIVIEQAKGVIAERRHLDMDQSFTLLRGAARTGNRRLSELARAVIDGSENSLTCSVSQRHHGVARQALSPARPRRTVDLRIAFRTPTRLSAFALVYPRRPDPAVTTSDSRRSSRGAVVAGIPAACPRGGR
jgi:hypothetical protein